MTVLDEASEWRERALAAEAIVAGLTEETTDGPVWVDTGEPIPSHHARLLDAPDATRHTLEWQKRRRLVTPWEVVP